MHSRRSHHLVNVFCWTVIHLCWSAKAILASPCSCGGSTAARASAGLDAVLENFRGLEATSFSFLGGGRVLLVDRWTLAACNSFQSRLLLVAAGELAVVDSLLVLDLVATESLSDAAVEA